MSDYNKALFTGRLTKDISLRYTPQGVAVADLGMAINENYKNAGGEIVEKTTFCEVTVWGKQAESCEEFIGKGSQVLVDGSLAMDQWETSEGERRSKLRIKANSIKFLDGRKLDQPEEEGF